MRSLLSSLALTLASILVGLLALEGGVRLVDGVPLLDTGNFVARTLNFLTTNPGAEYDPALGWVQLANTRFGPPGPIVTTGERGARMPGPQRRPLATGAILAVGDSFTAGSEVTDDSSWPAQLERMMGREVINAGVGGYGVDQTVLHAEALVPVLKPETLIVSVLSVDSMRNPMSVYGGAPKPYFVIENDELVLRNSPVPRTQSRMREIGWLRATLGHSHLMEVVMARLGYLPWWVGGFQYKEEYAPEIGVKVSCLLMKRLVALREKFGIRIGVVVQYGGGETAVPTPPWYGPPVSECAAREGLDVIDTFGALHGVLARDGTDAFHRLWVMHDDNRVYGHMSDTGNRLIASLIAQSLLGKAEAGSRLPAQ